MKGSSTVKTESSPLTTVPGPLMRKMHPDSLPHVRTVLAADYLPAEELLDINSQGTTYAISEQEMESVVVELWEQTRERCHRGLNFPVSKGDGFPYKQDNGTWCKFPRKCYPYQLILHSFDRHYRPSVLTRIAYA